MKEDSAVLAGQSIAAVLGFGLLGFGAYLLGLPILADVAFVVGAWLVWVATAK